MNVFQSATNLIPISCLRSQQKNSDWWPGFLAEQSDCDIMSQKWWTIIDINHRSKYCARLFIWGAKLKSSPKISFYNRKLESRECIFGGNDKKSSSQCIPTAPIRIATKVKSRTAHTMRHHRAPKTCRNSIWIKFLKNVSNSRRIN